MISEESMIEYWAEQLLKEFPEDFLKEALSEYVEKLNKEELVKINRKIEKQLIYIFRRADRTEMLEELRERRNNDKG